MKRKKKILALMSGVAYMIESTFEVGNLIIVQLPFLRSVEFGSIFLRSQLKEFWTHLGIAFKGGA